MAAPASRTALVTRIRRLLEAQEDRASDPNFLGFALALSKSMDLSALERRSGEEVIEVLRGVLDFVRTRAPEEIHVRVLPGEPAVIETCMRDQPFIYDTLRLLLDGHGVAVTDGFHGVIPLARDEAGTITGAASRGMPLESVIHLELEGVDTAEAAESLRAAAQASLAYARSAVRDFPQMVVAVEQVMDRFQTLGTKAPEAREELLLARRFLGWLLEHHFVFMALHYVPGGDGEPPPFVDGLGTHRLDPPDSDPIDGLLAAQQGPPFLRVRKSQRRSRLHRAGRLDHILARWFDAEGRAGGLIVLEGMFTYRALGRPASEVPMLAPLLNRLLDDSGLPADSYRARMIRYAFSVLPLEFLFVAVYEEVATVVDRILASAESRSVELHCVVNLAQQTAYVFVAMPRAEFDDELRIEIQELLSGMLNPRVCDHAVSLGVLETALIQYSLSGPELQLPDLEDLRESVLQLVAPWRERLRAALERRYEEPRVDRLLARYGEAFPEDYRRHTPPARTVADIEHIEELHDGRAMSFDLFEERIGGRATDPQLRIYERDDRILSELMPVLDHFGLLISSQFETRVTLPGGRSYSVDTFNISGVRGIAGAQVMLARERLLEALDAVFSHRLTDSPLNALLLRTEVTWRDVGLVRAYLAYARQLGFRFPPPLVQEVLLQHAEEVRALVRVFRIKFDPALEGDLDHRARALEDARRNFLERLDAIEDYAADRILHSLLNLVDATIRTNLYCRNGTADNLALKFECDRVEMMVRPAPVYEIFVHHTTVHGVHLRGGKVARGGLRWSDRVDDYRTEILGLMRTQMVKNAIIVPVGAKGGFVLTRPAENPRDRRAQADAAYRLFVGALLDVTDNLDKGTPVRPEQVICYDDDDYYLVVAADKGTAHLSDVANELSQARGFWLQDAFASGGTHGYDHKATGITARGAWECAKRHLREIGVNPYGDPISVIGIGDMSGDVFGNGLLCSRNFQLLAAFDHRHVFLDPDPDPEVSFAERERLFQLKGSSWADYDKRKISGGGGVFPRAAKEIPLSPRVRERFGIEESSMPGEQLIRAVLTLEVDLLWNGGIGTYIKASTEDNREVGDRANDPVRVDARDVRAKVIAEGGNLGVTQAGRAEYAAKGGRINIDATDNSGGVDLSDHEVNLKILFEPLCLSGGLSRDARNELLEEAKEECIERVLDTNRSQSRLLSLDGRRVSREWFRFARAIRFLADAVPFDPRNLQLPDERSLRARAQSGPSLLRPELALLIGYAKIFVKRSLLSEGALDPRSPRLWPLLLGYFPRRIAEAYRPQVAQHLLAPEIGMTVLVNRLVDDTGISFFPVIQEWSGRSTSEVAAAYLSAAEAADSWEVKQELETLEGQVEQDLIYQALLGVEDSLERAAGLLLSGIGGGTLESPGGAREILRNLPDGLQVRTAAHFARGVHRLVRTGLHDKLAMRVAGHDFLVSALHAADHSEATGTPAVETFSRLLEYAEVAEVVELEQRIGGLPAEGRFDAGALRTLRNRFWAHLGQLLPMPHSSATARAEQLCAEVEKALSSDLSIPALVTLEDRAQRIVQG